MLDPLVEVAIREDEFWGFRVSKLREERKTVFNRNCLKLESVGK